MKTGQEMMIMYSAQKRCVIAFGLATIVFVLLGAKHLIDNGALDPKPRGPAPNPRNNDPVIHRINTSPPAPAP